MCVINKLSYNHSCCCQLDRDCDHQTSTTTKVVDDSAYSSASAPSWTRTTVADGLFGSKASEPDTSRPVEKRNFGLALLHMVPLLGVIPSEFHRDLLRHKTRAPELSCGFVFGILSLAISVQLRLVTDGRTDGHAMTANIALA